MRSAMAALLAVILSACQTACPAPEKIVVVAAAPPPAQEPVGPRAVLLREAQTALRDAKRYRDISLTATRSGIIRSLEMAQDLRAMMRALRRHDTEANARAVRAALLDLQKGNEPP